MSILKELLSLNENDDDVVELTTFKGKTIPYSAWTDGVMYRGLNVYKTVYEGEGDDKLHAEMAKIIDRFDGSLDAQESYLGYSQSKDQFILGHDGWFTIESSRAGQYFDRNDDDDDDEDADEEENGNCSPYIIFTLTDEGKVQVVDSGADFSDHEKMWYGKNGGHDAAKKHFPDLVDIRLD